jgi:protein-S-isoprenylcysteine O-methyltransferase Ste14
MVALRSLSLIVWLVWLLVYWRGGFDLVAAITRSLRARPSRERSIYSARGAGLCIMGIVLLSCVMLATGYLIARGRIEDPMPQMLFPLALAGAAMILAGAAGTLYCRYHLGRLWSASAVLLIDHRVVDTGPYRLVRHPLYAFSCLMSLGTALVFLTWWNALAAVLMVGLYLFKMIEEERLLAQGLPGYREYQQQVRYRIAPRIW